MDNTKKLYCVFLEKELMGRFKNKDRANAYVIDCLSDGIPVEMKEMTFEEYQKYVAELLGVENDNRTY